MTGRSVTHRFYNHKWKHRLDDSYSVEIVAEYLTQIEAAILEKKLIEHYRLVELGLNKRPGSASGQVSRAGATNGEIWRKAHFNTHAKPVICIETGKVYPSARHAAKELGLQYSKISVVCNGKRNSTGGLHFEFHKKR